MPDLLPILFIIFAALALIVTLLWLWQSLRLAFVHTLATPASSDVVSPERAMLLAEKQSLLVALKDLEAERESGKLSTEDFQDLNEQYRQRAREVLRALDGMLSPHRDGARALLASVGAEPTNPAIAMPPMPVPSEPVGGVQTPVAPAADAAVSDVAAESPRSSIPTVKPAAESCSSCGAANDADAVFCKRCGTRLRTEVMG